MSVASTNSTGTNTSSTSSTSAPNGFSSLTAADFMKMLVAELQNQDPTQPMSNADLLSQLSQMTQLQSNTELSTTIQAMSTNQQLQTAASFIGATVTGTDANKNPISGIVTQASLQSGNAFVTVGNTPIPLSNITSVAPTSASSTSG